MAGLRGILGGGGRGVTPRAVWIAAVGVLAVVTAVVAVLALAPNEPVPSAGTVPPSAAAEPEPEQPEPEPEPAAPPASAAAVQRLLAVGAEPGHVLRAAVGACPDPAGALEVSFDGGATWASAATASVGATRLLQLDTADAAITRLVSQDAACAVQFARSFVGGTSWELADPAEGVWYVDPADAAVAHTSAGAQALPCQAVQLSGQGARAAVLCADATVTVSEDAGASWSAPLAVPGAVAVGVTPEGSAVASFGEAECASGVRTRAFVGGALGDAGACVDAPDAGAGQTAVAAGANGWYLWAGGRFVSSVDAGATWG